MNKQFFIFIFIVFTMLNGCVSQTKHDKVLSKCDSLMLSLENEKLINLELNRVIDGLNDSIVKLSYPADQRLNKILDLIKIDSLDLATEEIEKLKRIFPNSKEAKSINIQIAAIEKRKLEIKKEEERIKALGFKVLKDKSSVWVEKPMGDKIRYTFTNFRFGRTFTFNSIQNIGEYYYRTADKGNTYVLADMSIYTQSDYASKPSVYACKIVDGKLSSIGYFSSEYESYNDYGTYLGNYADTEHDFSKVNTVRYNIANEISLEDSRQPIIILMGKNDKIETVNGLTVSEVIEKCEVIKVLNRNKL